MKKIIITLCIAVSACTYANTVNLRPDAHAPIGVMADHMHHKHEIMVSHRFMVMQMNTLYNGTSKISELNVLSDYMMTPSSMQMSMHMLGAMWGYSDNITLTAMINYSSNEMSMINQMNAKSDMSSEGFGDLKIGAIFKVSESSRDQIIVNSSLSVPVGSIDEENSDGNHLPYGMQLGSGTYDLNLGTTYTAHKHNYSYGAQLGFLCRLGTNSNDYSLGNQYKLNAWAQKVWTNEISTSIRGTALFINDIEGEDSTLSAMVTSMSPLYSTNQGSIRGDIGFGINYYPKTTILKGNRLAGELNIPVFHHTDTINVVADSTITFGIQRTL